MDSSGVGLHRMGAEHLDSTRAWLGDARFRALIDSSGRRAPTAEENRFYWEGHWNDPSRLDFAIVAAEGRHLGNCGLSSIDRARREAELWLYIGAPQDRRSGFGTAAVRLLLNKAFAELGLSRVYLRVVAENAPALAFYKKLGFVEDPKLRQEWDRQGRFPGSIALARTKTLALLQPGYLPWAGFFDQILRSDVFLLYDDVQFDKNGWRNRNRIKTADGPRWLTVPVLTSGRSAQRILDVCIDNRVPWARKHLGTIRQGYAHASHFEGCFSELEKVLRRNWVRLVDLDIALIEWLCEKLGLRKPDGRSSAVEGLDVEDPSGRIVDLCERFGARRYLTGDSARNYLNTDRFSEKNIEVVWQSYLHPRYHQQFDGFVPFLSVLDLLLNEGPEARNVLKEAQRL